MSRGGGGSSNKPAGSETERKLAEIFSMDPDSLSRSDRSRLDHYLEKVGVDGREDINDGNSSRVLNIAKNMKQYSKDNNLDLSTGNSGALYRPEDVDLAFSKYQQSLPMDGSHPDRLVGEDEDGDGITDPMDVDPNKQGDQIYDTTTQAARDSGKTINVSDQIVGSKDGTRINLTDHQTSGLSNLSFGVTDDPNTKDDNDAVQDARANIAAKIETAFIDELYGTDNANIATQDWHGEGRGAIFGGDSDTPAINPMYGLDLVRTMPSDISFDPSKAVNSPRNQAYYEHVTRGQVDWSHYQQSPQYNRAFRELELDLGDLTVSNLTPGQRVELIRKADAHLEEQAQTRDEKGSDYRDQDGVREGELTDDWVSQYDPHRIQSLKQTLEGATEETTQLYVDGERQISMEERLGIPAGETREINVAPPGSDPIMQTVSSAYMNISRPTASQITDPGGGTYTIGGDINPRTGMARTSRSMTVVAAHQGRDMSYLDEPPTGGGAITWTQDAQGNNVASLTNAVERSPTPSITQIAIPDLPSSRRGVDRGRDAPTATTFNQGGDS